MILKLVTIELLLLFYSPSSFKTASLLETLNESHMTYIFKMQVVWQCPNIRLFRWDPPTSMEQSGHSVDEQAPS